ncbi:hypothetical protein [Nocardia abscessus]|uniref:hypothetical protein n=1 Tax=Nocardia abscessus TaxID=120957 RepID=UPI001C3F4B05|nr:hypothetical protein [Nocardia abscessus]MCC3328283.1 hypothetical protein [Nocardia abscessus]
MFTVHRGDLRRVSGRFGADLHHAAAYPMAGPSATGLADPRIGKREGLEGLTHQLATIYCPDSPLSANPWRIKTALEALRAVAARDEIGPQRYSALVDDAAACAMLDRADVARLVQARERSAPMPITAEQIYDLVVASACRLFGVPVGHRELITALHSIRPTVHLLDGFQYAVLAATIILYGPQQYRRSAASALHVVAAAIDPGTLTSAHHFLEALTRISPVEFSRGVEHPNRIMRQHLQGLRRDYYAALGPHNFGARPVPGYHGPTVVNATIVRSFANE